MRAQQGDASISSVWFSNTEGDCSLVEFGFSGRASSEEKSDEKPAAVLCELTGVDCEPINSIQVVNGTLFTAAQDGIRQYDLAGLENHSKPSKSASSQ